MHLHVDRIFNIYRRICFMITDKIAMICGKKSFERYLFGALVALELLMSFTFLGYIHIPPISITIAYIPVMIAACLLGPGRAVIIGVLFGLGSLMHADGAAGSGIAKDTRIYGIRYDQKGHYIFSENTKYVFRGG